MAFWSSSFTDSAATDTENWNDVQQTIYIMMKQLKQNSCKKLKMKLSRKAKRISWKKFSYW
jgi:hypothetical protein